MTDPRLRTIRTLLCLGLGCLFFGVGWLWAGLGFTALGLFMPVFAAVAPCGACAGALSSQFQVVIPGISNSGAGCTTCGDYNGTWTLTTTDYTLIPNGVSGSCYAIHELTTCLCHTSSSGADYDTDGKHATNLLILRTVADVINVAFKANSIFGSETNCHNVNNDGASLFVWGSSPGAGSLNCSALSSYSIPLAFDAADDCDSDGSPVLVTSI